MTDKKDTTHNPFASQSDDSQSGDVVHSKPGVTKNPPAVQAPATPVNSTVTHTTAPVQTLDEVGGKRRSSVESTRLEDLENMKRRQEFIDEFGGESNIPINHQYWNLRR